MLRVFLLYIGAACVRSVLPSSPLFAVDARGQWQVDQPAPLSEPGGRHSKRTRRAAQKAPASDLPLVAAVNACDCGSIRQQQQQRRRRRPAAAATG
jgi:hypothetical protein